jgi:hypothetical protein
VLLESTHFKARDGRENGKWIKIDLTLSSPGPFKWEMHQTNVYAYGAYYRVYFKDIYLA